MPLRDEQGIALFISLMLLALMSVMSLIMVLTVSPDMLINGYYGNFRGSFYAADSGLNIARQQLVNQVTSSTYVSMTPCIGWGTGGAAGCTSAAAGLLDRIGRNGRQDYCGFTLKQFRRLWRFYFFEQWIIRHDLVAGDFSARQHYDLSQHLHVTDASGKFTPTVTGTMTARPPRCPGIVNGTVRNTVPVQLSALRAWAGQGSHQVYTSEYGVISLNIAAQTSTSKQTVVSFASFGDFIYNFSPCFGALIPGTMTGPMFTNGAWQFRNVRHLYFYRPGRSNQSPTRLLVRQQLYSVANLQL